MDLASKWWVDGGGAGWEETLFRVRETKGTRLDEKKDGRDLIFRPTNIAAVSI